MNKRSTAFLALAIAFTLTLCQSFTPSARTRLVLRKFTLSAKQEDDYEDLINDFCQGTNDIWKQLVI
jgi:hypothetical protein